MKSMTGYGRVHGVFGTRKITCEIRSINSKQLDLYGRIPEEYKIFENDFRSRISEVLLRGKIEYIISVEKVDKNSSVIDEEAVKGYIEGLRYLSKKNSLPLNSESILPLAVQLSAAPQIRTSVKEISSGEKKLMFSIFEKTLKEIEQTRSVEGLALKNDLLLHVKAIENILSKKIIPFDKKRIPYMRKRLTKKLQEVLDASQIDGVRFEQEMFFYLERFDITEEITRLKQHCKFFNTTCKDNDAAGKKLGFIAQEMGREINTIGSKSNDVAMQQSVVEMKDELEKIKEQLSNIL
ncbi:MAG: YicC family protein [Bacteroidales bacterium]|nr:YicC family protein [Bacteroidales bacterium]